jgi:hypothetical protein
MKNKGIYSAHRKNYLAKPGNSSLNSNSIAALELTPYLRHVDGYPRIRKNISAPFILRKQPDIFDEP